jgi:hypothetical protein
MACGLPEGRTISGLVSDAIAGNERRTSTMVRMRITAPENGSKPKAGTHPLNVF